MLLYLIAHLFINKLRMKYSCKLCAPGSALYIDESVSLDEYLEAAIDMMNDKEIIHTSISAAPARTQQVLTIGLIRSLIVAIFTKFGAVL